VCWWAMHCQGPFLTIGTPIPNTQSPIPRKTPLGELNWIFTAITDTIAWNVLPRALFQKLFRQVHGDTERGGGGCLLRAVWGHGERGEGGGGPCALPENPA
jgi:hypothetical protein